MPATSSWPAWKKHHKDEREKMVLDLWSVEGGREGERDRERQRTHGVERGRESISCMWGGGREQSSERKRGREKERLREGQCHSEITLSRCSGAQTMTLFSTPMRKNPPSACCKIYRRGKREQNSGRWLYYSSKICVRGKPRQSSELSLAITSPLINGAHSSGHR